jgi:hypothetical protein
MEDALVYRTLDASFWTDPKVRSLNPSGKLALLYLITNPHSHVSGIYVLPRAYAIHDTGLDGPTLDTLYDILSRLGIGSFDRDNEVVWVVNMLSYQGRGEKNLRSAANQLSTLHNSSIITDFLIRYPKVKQYVSDTVLDRVSAVGTPNRNRNRTGTEGEREGDPGEPETNPALLRLVDGFLKTDMKVPLITATEIVERERAVFAPVDDLMGKSVIDVMGKRVIDLIHGNGTLPAPAGLQPEVGKKRARQIPEDFKVTTVMREWAASQDMHVDLDLETARMIDHFKANGEPKADWIATWRNWIRRAPQFNGNGNGNGRKDQTKAPAIEHPDHEAHPTHFCSDCNEAHAWTCENFGQPVRCGSPTHSACPKFAARFRR